MIQVAFSDFVIYVYTQHIPNFMQGIKHQGSYGMLRMHRMKFICLNFLNVLSWCFGGGEGVEVL